MTGVDGDLPRCKPFKYTYQKEIVMYAHYKKLLYFSTECIYAPDAYRGHAREYLKELEVVRPSVILDIIKSAEGFGYKDTLSNPKQTTCTRCGYMSSNALCKACILLEGLEKGIPDVMVGNARKRKKKLAELEEAVEETKIECTECVCEE
eukprot:TRINITY_DN7096_c0_g1_i2.p2 TRINITY_DN7096_c0_g1~~TRINITY_DN7096_c0_g1_i2.p2  ORF type:complete len:150 (+),score=38.06 TRINITY_DN7096_c0_g1_i2:749-1198(+)